MAPMSGPEQTEGLLTHLENELDTGCLTITSASQGVCRVYLIMGEAFHAVGPTGEGDAALAAALTWPDVTLSFDESAELPSKETITTRPRRTVAEKSVAETSAGAATFPTLSDNQRVLRARGNYLGSGCLWFLAVLVTLGAVVASGALGRAADAVIGICVVLMIATAALFLVVYERYRVIFMSEAVDVQGGLAKGDIPLVVDGPTGVAAGEPELVVSLPTRCLAGNLGKCRIEMYSDGLQIWKGPENPEPRWQFSYRDRLQAESVATTNLGRYSRDQYFLRIVAARPRMVFVLGSTWLVNPGVTVMLSKLAEHRVPTFTET